MLDQFHKISEIVAAFAIVGSLIFVGLQVRQNTDALQNRAAQANSDSWQNLTLSLANNPKIAAVMAANTIVPENSQGQLAPELLQVAAYVNANIKSMETNYHQWLSGNLSDELFNAARSGFVFQLEIQPLMELAITGPAAVSYTERFMEFAHEALAEARAKRAAQTSVAE